MKRIFGDPEHFNEDFKQAVQDPEHEIGNLKQKVLFGQQMIQKLWYKLRQADLEIKELKGKYESR